MNRIKEFHLKWMDFAINNYRGKDRVEQITAEIVHYLLVLFFAAMLIWSAFFYFGGNTSSLKMYVNIAATVTLLFGVFSLKYAKSINIALSIIALLSYVFVTVSVWITGGINSNDIFWYSIIVVSDILFIKTKLPLLTFALSVLTIIYFYVIEVFYGIQLSAGDSFHTSVHYVFFSTLFITILLCVLAFFLMLSNKKLQDALDQKQEFEIKEDIAMDFHDNLGNKLASIIQLSNVAQATSNEEVKSDALEKINSLSNESYHDFRDFIWAQKNEAIPLSELSNYIKDFGEDLFESTATQFYASNKSDVEGNVPLTSSLTKEIISITKEILTNAMKHAQANKLHLSFAYAQQVLKVAIKDDGIGFDPQMRSNGSGLRNIDKRINRITGSSIELSSDDNGTEIIITIPLKP